MKKRHGSIVFACGLLMACHATAAEVTVEFTGVLTSEGKVKLALTDKTTSTTRWVEPGEDFAGFAIARYDAKNDAVYLKKGLEEHRIFLVPSKSTLPASGSATSVAATAANDAAAAAIRSNLRQFVAAARRFQAAHGATQVSYSDVVGPDKPIRALTPVAGENYTTLTLGPSSPTLSVTTATGAVVSLDTTGAAAGTAAVAGTAAAPGIGSAANTPAPLPLPTNAPTAGGPVATTPAAPAPSMPTDATTGLIPAPAAPANAVASQPLGITPTDPAAATPPATPRTPDAGDALAPTGSRYTTRSGDTLADIARANGVSVQDLQTLNPGLNAGSLPAGQTIRIR